MRYFRWNATPTGINRVQGEIISALLSLNSETVGFCRLDRSGQKFELVEPDLLRNILAQQSVVMSAYERSRLAGLFALLMRNVRSALRSEVGSSFHVTAARSFVQTVSAGDVLLNIGATWEHDDYSKAVQHSKEQHGIIFGLLVHDIIPLSHPQFVVPHNIPIFKNWLDRMSGVWDFVIAPSQSTADALHEYLENEGRKVPRISKLTFGSGFSNTDANPLTASISDEPFVLFVSTVEVRKNHELMVRIWQRLIDKHGEAQVPRLVFAGKQGWQVESLMEKLKSSNFLNRKIILTGAIDDQTISKAYQDCQFTVFPSYCEGWGLPVSESLAHGKFCIATNATSVPEVAGSYADYFDPNDTETAFRLVERAIFDEAYLISRETKISKSYASRSWHETAIELLGLVDQRSDC